jgi:hypothetical protein
MRVSNGGFDPLDRLAIVRRTYFPTNLSLGRLAVEVMRQSDTPAYSLYRENAMVVLPPAVFVTIHTTGSNNNREYKTAQGAPNPFYDNDREYVAAMPRIWCGCALPFKPRATIAR